MVLLPPYSGFMDAGIKHCKWECHHSWSIGKMFASCFYDLRLCWSRYISSQKRNTSTWRHISFIELEVKTGTHPLWVPHTFEPWQRRDSLSWFEWSFLITKGKSDCYYTVEMRKSMSGIMGNSFQHLLTLPCPVIKVNGKL